MDSLNLIISLNHNFHLLIAQESNEEEEQENNAFATLPNIFQWFRSLGPRKATTV